ncbi:MAG TPA: hypothetical protein VMV23_11070 [Candidatus Nanopelagicaceae bacterium]|nr:hypothetical protein [Candidatus Nanopelagicaceae bacterium]
MTASDPGRLVADFRRRLREAAQGLPPAPRKPLLEQSTPISPRRSLQEPRGSRWAGLWMTWDPWLDVMALVFLYV